MTHPLNLQAFNYYRKIIELKRKQQYHFWEMVAILKEIKEKKLYRYLGEGGYNSFKQFLADPEVDLKYSTVNAYIDIYNTFIERLGKKPEELADISVIRLNMLKAKVKSATPNEAEELIAKAKTLSYNDFKEEIKQEKRTPKVKISKCERCGKLIIHYQPDKICTCDGYLHIEEMGEEK